MSRVTRLLGTSRTLFTYERRGIYKSCFNVGKKEASSHYQGKLLWWGLVEVVNWGVSLFGWEARGGKSIII